MKYLILLSIVSLTCCQQKKQNLGKLRLLCRIDYTAGISIKNGDTLNSRCDTMTYVVDSIKFSPNHQYLRIDAHTNSDPYQNQFRHKYTKLLVLKGQLGSDRFYIDGIKQGEQNSELQTDTVEISMLRPAHSKTIKNPSSKDVKSLMDELIEED